MALILLDASILIALLDPADGLHAPTLQAVVASAADEIAIPASALAETLVAPARAGKLQAARAAIRLLSLRVTPIDEPVAVEAARLRSRHKALRLPDALVIASGEVLRARTILTGDSRWRSVSKRVTIVA
jgi:predicted nucleic acid-binding protein